MRLFGDGLPGAVNCGGEMYPIRTDFREWMRFELLMLDKDIPDRMKLTLANRLVFEKIPPVDTTEFLLWFYRCGVDPVPTKAKGTKSPPAAYSFEHDESMIFAAFMQCYRIDLCETEMHWWKFRALFDSLSDDTKIKNVMGWRVMDIDEKKLGAEQARHYKKLKELYKLPRSLSEQQKIDSMKRSLKASMRNPSAVTKS